MNMKGIILAGGNGLRLHPLTKVTNKHLLPIYNKPMIMYPLEKLIECGIKDIIIVSGRGHVGHFLELLGSGGEFGVNLSYEVQERAGGIAEALGLCEKWVGRTGNITVILGDNIFGDKLSKPVSSFQSGAHLFITEHESPERFGVAIINSEGEILNIVEKPDPSPSPYVITGAYIYDHRVFSFIKTLTPSARNELEITDVNNMYLKMHELNYTKLHGFWSDAGTFDSLYNASQMIYNQVHHS